MQLKIPPHAHAQERAEMDERIKPAVDDKEAATARLAFCKHRGMRFDCDIRPEDVRIDLHAGEVLIAGPMNLEA